MIPEGTYRARATDGHLGYTSKGNEQVVVTFAITGGPHEGQAVTWFGFFSDACFDRTIRSLRHCGWQGNDVSDLTGIDTRDVDIVVEHNEYKGKITPRVSWVNQIGGLSGMTPDQATDFARSIASRIETMAPAEPVADEQVPF